MELNTCAELRLKCEDWVGFYPAGLGLFLQGLDAAAVGTQVGHQGLVLLQQSLLKNNY